MSRRFALRTKLLPSLAGAAMLATLSQPAAASAIFDWVSISGHGTGTMTVTDTAYAAGHWAPNISFGGNATTTANDWAASGIASVGFRSDNPLGANLDFNSATPFFPDTSEHVQGTFTLSADGLHLIGGFTNLADDNNDLSMSSNSDGSLFTIGFNGSENPNAVCRGQENAPASCHLTGYWLLSNPPAPTSGVPEPASALLLLFGMIPPLFRRPR